MGKKRSAARRAAATAAPAPALAPTASPAAPFDAHAALDDMPAASTVRESPTDTQHPRVSHEADATRAPRAASPAHLPVETTLVLEPAHTNPRTATSVAIATPQARAARALEPCPEPPDSPPALTTPTSTSSDVSANSPQQPHISNRADTFSALRAPFPTLSIHAAADLATAVDRAGPPNDFFAGPAHLFARANTCGRELETLATRIRPATSIEEIDSELLANIIEDAQSLMRIEARREVRVKALEEGRKRGWNEGFEEGGKLAKREARHEVRQREQGWQDGYELGRWDGYREGLEAARIEVSTHPRVDAHIQTDNAPCPHSPPLPSPSHAGSPLPIPLDTVLATPHANADVQTDDHAPKLSTPTYACTTTSRVSASAQTHDLTPPHATEYTDAGVQAADPPPPSPSNDTHSRRPRVHASMQTDAPRSSAPACARIVQEIEPGLLTEILAKAIARGEAAGLKNGKHVGFQDGLEAGWKSGTKEGREDGYREGKQSGIIEGREQYRLEVSRIPRAVAVVQTDYGPLPPRVDSASQTATVLVARRPTITSTPSSINSHQCTFIPPANGNIQMLHDSFTTTTNTSFTSNNVHSPFSWADDTSLLPITNLVSVPSCVPRDFSVLRSTSHHPFESLKRRARRSQPRPLCSTRSLPRPRPSIPMSFEPVITRRHPAGLRADRPAVVVSPSSMISHSVQLDTLPLDWQGDPRLHELGRVLRGLGWVHSSGS